MKTYLTITIELLLMMYKRLLLATIDKPIIPN